VNIPASPRAWVTGEPDRLALGDDVDRKPKSVKSDLWKGLGEHVYQIVGRGNVLESDGVVFDLLAQEVVPDSDVLRAPVIDRFLDRAMHPLLSLRIETGWSIGRPTLRSSSSKRSHIACLVASADAMYSASVVDRATVG
jgi:hypothetical protein